MIARVLEGEIDAVRTSLDDAVDVVRTSVVPVYRAPHGRETYRVALAAIDELERKATELHAKF